MSKVVLRIYIPRTAKADVRSWKRFGRKRPLSHYLLETVQEAAIGEADLFQVIAGYFGHDSDWAKPYPGYSRLPGYLRTPGKPSLIPPVVPRAIGFERCSLAHPRALRNVASLDAGAASASLLQRGLVRNKRFVEDPVTYV